MRIIREKLCLVVGVVVFFVGISAEAANIAPAGVATQSSTLSTFTANLAINGNLGDFTHTNGSMADPSWEVAFPINADISEIVIHNRDNCCGSRLRDITVEILDMNGIDVNFTSALLNPENTDNTTGNTFLGPDNIALNLVGLTGDTVSGGIVRISRTSDPDLSGTGGAGDVNEANVLSLGEVEIFSDSVFPYNLALNKPAFQSTDLNASSYPASRATDGVINNTNFTHTTVSDPDPTLGVDLGLRSDIHEIILHNRVGCCPERLRDITVSIEDELGNEMYSSGLLNPGNVDGGPGQIALDLVALTGGPVQGANIIVKRTPDAGDPNGGVLSLAEVEAFGLPVENIALNKPATQSSGYLGDQFPATNATNGNLADFTHTDGVVDAEPTLMIDLLEIHEIDDLFVHNRDDCCGGRFRDIIVEILDDEMQAVFTSELLNPGNSLGDGGYDQLNVPEFLYLNLDGVVGRYIRISRDTAAAGNTGAEPDPIADQLTLSVGEVVAYGTLVPEPSVGLMLLAGGLLAIRRRG